MINITGENIATILIDGSAVFLLVGILTQTGVMRKRGRLDDRLFISICVLNIIVALSDIVTYLADGKSFTGARFFNMAGTSVFYMALSLLVMTWLLYTMIRFKKVGGREALKTRIWLFIPGFILELLLVINLFAGFIFSVDETNTYHRGVLFIPMFVVMGFYVGAGFRYMGKYRVGTKDMRLVPVWLYMIPAVAGLLVPFVLGGISLASIGVSMSVAFTHFGSASEIVESDRAGGKTV